VKYGRLLLTGGALLFVLWLLTPVTHERSWWLPDLGSGERVRPVTCSRNLRELSMAVQMYCQDWDTRFPPADAWDERVAPYRKGHSSYPCPVVKHPARVKAVLLPVHVTTYAFNRNLAGSAAPAVREPKTVVTLFETFRPGNGIAGTADAVAWPPRHNGGSYYAFVDGSVRWSDRTPSFGTSYGRSTGP
jgi:prepilin-type processing-associated H-X9-DG protein